MSQFKIWRDGHLVPTSQPVVVSDDDDDDDDDATVQLEGHFSPDFGFRWGGQDPVEEDEEEIATEIDSVHDGVVVADDDDFDYDPEEEDLWKGWW